MFLISSKWTVEAKMLGSIDLMTDNLSKKSMTFEKILTTNRIE